MCVESRKISTPGVDEMEGVELTKPELSDADGTPHWEQRCVSRCTVMTMVSSASY